VLGKRKGGLSLLFTSVSREEDNSYTLGFRISRVNNFLIKKKREINKIIKKKERLKDNKSKNNNVREITDLLFK
jgi:hypothetical protein